MVAHRWSLPAQAVTSISCVNSALSHLLIAAASDRSIVVLDAAHGTIARTIAKVRERDPLELPFGNSCIR
jgi:hypothetical protein